MAWRAMRHPSATGTATAETPSASGADGSSRGPAGEADQTRAPIGEAALGDPGRHRRPPDHPPCPRRGLQVAAATGGPGGRVAGRALASEPSPGDDVAPRLQHVAEGKAVVLDGQD